MALVDVSSRSISTLEKRFVQELCENCNRNVPAQVAQAHCGGLERHCPAWLVDCSYSGKVVGRCMERYSLLTGLAGCALGVALRLAFGVFLFFFVF